jgi:hypothetical protein
MNASERVSPAARHVADDYRYILITQCLQNDLFLNTACRLFLGEPTARAMLTGIRGKRQRNGSGRLEFPPDAIANGPLALFLEATIGRRRRGTDGHGTLHVINIRDWHVPGPTYDLERRTYGAHCEKGTWGAGYVDCLEGYLDPAGSTLAEEARFFSEGSVSVYHIHSDSVFDFRPRVDDGPASEGKLPTTELEDILDILIQGTDAEVAAAKATLTKERRLEAISDLAHGIDTGSDPGVPIYLGVIGVYSDIKVLTLIGGINSRYRLPNLGLSDTLSASPSLERHIAGLDFADKVMDVEIVHGVNDLVRYLGGTPPLEDESKVIGPDSFSRYKSFFKDKQSVLAYQSEKLQDYLGLTEQKALDTYTWIRRSNLFLIIWGSVFLVATLVLSIWAAVDPEAVDWKAPLITGGVGLVQLVTAFYSRPMRDLSRNLTNFATYRMVLESHSLKMAFARFHLTTPYTLREVRTPEEAAEAKRQIEVLEAALGVIEKFDEGDYRALKDLGFSVDQAALEGVAPGGNGAGPGTAGKGQETPQPPAE